MFKVGDKVRFVTDEPSYGAVYYDGVMTVLYTDSCGPDEPIVCLEYPKMKTYRDRLTQEVSPEDIEVVS